LDRLFERQRELEHQIDQTRQELMRVSIIFDGFCRFHDQIS